MESQGDNGSVGRAKTAILVQGLGEPVAILTEIYAQAAAGDSGKRITFRGPVKVADKTVSHLETVILPIVDRITCSLNQPPRDYILSISNISASATREVGLLITGYSADLSFFLALLSAGLQAAIRQDLMATGHIGSLAGDVVPVLGVAAKIEAAIASGDVTEFLFPDLEKDPSAELLAPRDEYDRERQSLHHLKGRMQLTAIRDVQGAVEAFFPEEAIVRSALAQGYFDLKSGPGENHAPVDRIISFLTRDHEKHFWEAVKDHLFRLEAAKARSLLKAFVNYHLGQGSYPKNFGEGLYRLVLSLPLLNRRLDGLFPLLPVDLCIALSQNTTERDHSDVRMLFKLTSPDELAGKEGAVIQEGRDQEEGSSQGWTLRKILFELGETNLTRRIGLPLDEARAGYPMNAVTVKDGPEFNEAVTRFFLHLMRHTQSPDGHVSREAAAAEAIDLVEQAFSDTGGYSAALAEAQSGTRGGLRHVFDRMTDCVKRVTAGKYSTMVLKEAVDPLDWEAKLGLARHIHDHYGRYLPESFRGMPSGQLATHLEEGIRLLSEAERSLERWIRKH